MLSENRATNDTTQQRLTQQQQHNLSTNLPDQLPIPRHPNAAHLLSGDTATEDTTEQRWPSSSAGAWGLSAALRLLQSPTSRSPYLSATTTCLESRVKAPADTFLGAFLWVGVAWRRVTAGVGKVCVYRPGGGTMRAHIILRSALLMCVMPALPTAHPDDKASGPAP